MEQMGMTDKQFNAFIRGLIRDLKRMTSDMSKEEILSLVNEIIEDLQKDLEN